MLTTRIATLTHKYMCAVTAALPCRMARCTFAEYLQAERIGDSKAVQAETLELVLHAASVEYLCTCDRATNLANVHRSSCDASKNFVHVPDVPGKRSSYTDQTRFVQLPSHSRVPVKMVLALGLSAGCVSVVHGTRSPALALGACSAEPRPHAFKSTQRHAQARRQKLQLACQAASSAPAASATTELGSPAWDEFAAAVSGLRPADCVAVSLQLQTRCLGKTISIKYNFVQLPSQLLLRCLRAMHYTAPAGERSGVDMRCRLAGDGASMCSKAAMETLLRRL